MATTPPFPMLRAAIHDLKGPVAHLSILTEMLQRPGCQGDAELLQHIGEASARLDTVVEALRQYVEVAGSKVAPENLDLQEILEISTFHARAVKGGNELTVQNGPLPGVWADRKQILWIFDELLRNAIRYRSDLPPAVMVRSERSSLGDWLISFEDNGRGIDPEYAERMFLPFTRLGFAAGAGLGLHICRVAAEMNGGFIMFKPATCGVRIELQLPAAHDLAGGLQCQYSG